LEYFRKDITDQVIITVNSYWPKSIIRLWSESEKSLLDYN
jgi:hypothetical protein